MAVAFMLTSFFLTYDTSNKAKSSVTEVVAEEQQQAAPLTAETPAAETEAAPSE